MATQIRRTLLTAAFLTLATSAWAQGGTQAEQDACRPDVRRFCHQLAADAGAQIYLQCLQEHRAQLSHACRGVLDGHGV